MLVKLSDFLIFGLALPSKSVSLVFKCFGLDLKLRYLDVKADHYLISGRHPISGRASIL